MFIERAPKVANAIARNLGVLNGKTVSIDLDGVVQATWTRAILGANKAFGTAYTRDDLVSYWEMVNLVRKNGVPEENCLEHAKSLWNNDSVYSLSPEVPGIGILLKILKDINSPVIFNSSRPSEFYKVTCEWFAGKFPWIDPDAIIMQRPDGMSGEEYKPRVVREKNVGLHIEDAASEAEAIALGTSAKVILVPYPWNIGTRVDNANVMQLEGYSDASGVWPVIRFLASPQARDFLCP